MPPPSPEGSLILLLGGFYAAIHDLWKAQARLGQAYGADKATPERLSQIDAVVKAAMVRVEQFDEAIKEMV
jgi:hypothetical protein